MSLCEAMGMPEPTTREALGALELQASLMARAGVVVTFQEWTTFSPTERLVLADAKEQHGINLAMIQGAAARSAIEAANVFGVIDGGRTLVNVRLQLMAAEALS